MVNLSPLPNWRRTDSTEFSINAASISLRRGCTHALHGRRGAGSMPASLDHLLTALCDTPSARATSMTPQPSRLAALAAARTWGESGGMPQGYRNRRYGQNGQPMLVEQLTRREKEVLRCLA